MSPKTILNTIGFALLTLVVTFYIEIRFDLFSGVSVLLFVIINGVYLFIVFKKSTPIKKGDSELVDKVSDYWEILKGVGFLILLIPVSFFAINLAFGGFGVICLIVVVGVKLINEFLNKRK